MRNINDISSNLSRLVEELDDILYDARNTFDNLDSALDDAREIEGDVETYIDDMDNQRDYLKVVCNFLNNLKGYITDEELKELFNIVDLEYDKNDFDYYVEKCSEFVRDDEQDEFADFIFENGKRY
jgi:hypothetical protein